MTNVIYISKITSTNADWIFLEYDNVIYRFLSVTFCGVTTILYTVGFDVGLIESVDIFDCLFCLYI